MKIGVVGHGVVGGAVAAGMERLGHEVLIHDTKYNTSIELVKDCDIVFICVPSPQREDGSCDTTIVEEVVDQLVHLVGFRTTIAIKSTVAPGFTQRLIDKYCIDSRLVFVPEFLREKSAFYDFTEGHDVCIVGGYDKERIDQVFAAHGHYPKNFVSMKPTEAELAKYFSNVFNALRVTFANGFYDVAKALGVDYSKIKNALVKRPTIQDIYLDCNENWRGFAGVCLPKDTAAFAKLVEDLGVKARIFKTIVEDNKLYKPTVPDGMRLVDNNQVVS